MEVQHDPARAQLDRHLVGDHRADEPRPNLQLNIVRTDGQIKLPARKRMSFRISCSWIRPVAPVRHASDSARWKRSAAAYTGAIRHVAKASPKNMAQWIVLETYRSTAALIALPLLPSWEIGM